MYQNIIRKSERIIALNETRESSGKHPRANQAMCLSRDVYDLITVREAFFFPSLYLWCNRFALSLCAGV